MAYGIAPNSSASNLTFARPSVTSYDSGSEHSFAHYVDVKLLVQDADREPNAAPATLAGRSS